MDRAYECTENIIRMRRLIDLNDASAVDAFRHALQRMSTEHTDEIVLDFSEVYALSSTIIAMVFLAWEVLRDTPASLTVVASMQHNRSLVSMGLPAYAQLRLCG